MPSSESYRRFILDQLSAVEGIDSRAMMGEYLLYCQGRLFGGVYDDRLLVKPVPAALALLPDAPREQPYPGGAEMLLVEEVDDREFLAGLRAAMVPELPERRRK